MGCAEQTLTRGAIEPIAPGTDSGRFHCPEAGTRVEFKGRFERWLGTATNNPNVCLRDIGGEAVQYAGLFRESAGSELFDETARAFALLWPLRTGASVTFVRSRTEPAGRKVDYRVTLTSDGQGNVTVGDKNRQAWIVTRTVEGVYWPFNATDRYWIDKTTMAVIRYDYDRPLTSSYRSQTATQVSQRLVGP